MAQTEWSYGYSASVGFATEEKVSSINTDIDLILKTRISTKVEGDSVTFTFSKELSDDDKVEINRITQLLVDNSKPKNKFITVYPKIDNTNSTTFTLLGRLSYKKITPEQTLDYIDIMTKMDVDAINYSIKIICGNIDVAVFSSNNTEYEIKDMGRLQDISNSSIFEIYAKVDDSKGSVYIDQIQLYYS